MKKRNQIQFTSLPKNFIMIHFFIATIMASSVSWMMIHFFTIEYTTITLISSFVSSYIMAYWIYKDLKHHQSNEHAFQERFYVLKRRHSFKKEWHKF